MHDQYQGWIKDGYRISTRVESRTYAGSVSGLDKGRIQDQDKGWLKDRYRISIRVG